MPTIRKATARLLAVLALAAVVIVVITVISNTVGNDSKKGHNAGKVTKKHKPSKKKQKEKTPKTYTVKSGDTLTSISHTFGVPINRILALNPSVDPLVLNAGQQLKLR